MWRDFKTGSITTKESVLSSTASSSFTLDNNADEDFKHVPLDFEESVDYKDTLFNSRDKNNSKGVSSNQHTLLLPRSGSHLQDQARERQVLKQKQKTFDPSCLILF